MDKEVFKIIMKFLRDSDLQCDLEVFNHLLKSGSRKKKKLNERLELNYKISGKRKDKMIRNFLKGYCEGFFTDINYEKEFTDRVLMRFEDNLKSYYI